MLELRQTYALLILLLHLSLTRCAADYHTVPKTQELVIYHRFLDSRQSVNEQQAKWLPKGKATWSSLDGPIVWSKSAQDVDVVHDPTQGFYQVSVGASGADQTNSFSSVSLNKLRACAFGSVQEHIWLYIHSEGSTAAPRLSYQLQCSTGTTEDPSASSGAFNTTLHLSVPARIPAPILNKPVEIVYEADGRVKQPEREKSLIQKYWMYVVPILLLVLLSGGSEENSNKR